MCLIPASLDRLSFPGTSVISRERSSYNESRADISQKHLLEIIKGKHDDTVPSSLPPETPQYASFTWKSGKTASIHPSIHPLSYAAGGLDSRLPLHASSFTPVRGSPWNRVPSAPSSQPGSCFPLLEDQRHQITSRWL